MGGRWMDLSDILAEMEPDIAGKFSAAFDLYDAGYSAGFEDGRKWTDDGETVTCLEVRILDLEQKIAGLENRLKMYEVGSWRYQHEGHPMQDL